MSRELAEILGQMPLSALVTPRRNGVVDQCHLFVPLPASAGTEGKLYASFLTLAIKVFAKNGL